MLNRNTNDPALLGRWVEEMAAHFSPDRIHWCDGSQREYDEMCHLLVEKGTFIPLNPEKRPGSFACFSDPSDVARVEDRTFICCRRKQDAGPTNNWMDPLEMKNILTDLTRGAMAG
ncbi:MAG: phosphoenolpyruvate carboxykinase (GTP), partial [Chitinophagia bacterium]|nr:phosphoenolpyruvate carboxykinase (GTP) [Chitinophagia bacterium]